MLRDFALSVEWIEDGWFLWYAGQDLGDFFATIDRRKDADAVATEIIEELAPARVATDQANAVPRVPHESMPREGEFVGALRCIRQDTIHEGDKFASGRLGKRHRTLVLAFLREIFFRTADANQVMTTAIRLFVWASCYVVVRIRRMRARRLTEAHRARRLVERGEVTGHISDRSIDFLMESAIDWRSVGIGNREVFEAIRAEDYVFGCDMVLFGGYVCAVFRQSDGCDRRFLMDLEAIRELLEQSERQFFGEVRAVHDAFLCRERGDIARIFNFKE